MVLVLLSITGLALKNPAYIARHSWNCRPRHYHAALASDEGTFGSDKVYAQLFQ